MFAANGAADETVAFLLFKGASPDLINEKGQTAFMFAIHSTCSTTIELLAPVTQNGFEGALVNLAICQTELTPAGKELLVRASSDKVAFRSGMEEAARHGLSLIHI